MPAGGNDGPPPGADLPGLVLHPMSSARWSLGPTATAAQLACITRRTDAALRALELKRKDTGEEYIPKAVRGKRDTLATLRGLIEYLDSQEYKGGLPKQCANMSDVEAIYGITVDMQQYARKHGLAPEAFEASNRVNVIPLLKGFKDLFDKIFAGGGAQLKGLKGFEELDSDLQLARVRKEDADDRARNNALANKLIHTREGIERELGEPLAAIATGWKNFEKDTGGKLKSLLQGAGVDPAIIRQAIQIVVAGVKTPVEKVRELITPNPQTELEKAA